jgi:hypothetical protein
MTHHSPVAMRDCVWRGVVGEVHVAGVAVQPVGAKAGAIQVEGARLLWGPRESVTAGTKCARVVHDLRIGNLAGPRKQPGSTGACSPVRKPPVIVAYGEEHT